MGGIRVFKKNNFMEVKMRYKGKRVLALIIVLIVCLYPINLVSAESSIIYETSSKQIITSGVTLENIVRFTVDGWLNINVLKVDLSNPYIEVDTLINADSIKRLTTTKSLAESRGAVAAINASFFNPTGNGSGYPDGPIVESGKIISAASEYNRYGDVMASFSIDNLNNILYNYWKTDITLIAPNGNAIPVAQYNKPSKTNYSDITILDRRWSDSSIGATQAYPDIVEMVVDGGKVVEIRKAQPAVQIPVNGFVVVTRQQNAGLLENNFQVGDSVHMDITTNPDWSNLKMSVTGASILLKDGKVPDKFSFDISSISGKQPRTAIGSSKDGKQLMLVTVDGRQGSSIGMTQAETAQLMLQLGAYNALNLDGGRSTTMVARPLGTTGIRVVNSPSDGTSRAVSTAIGVFSIAPPAPLEGLVIETEDTNVFVNTSRAFTVKGYDRYFNPVQINPEDVEWSVSGLKGTFKGNVFYPESVGEGVITASIGNVSGSINISSLSSPVQLQLSDKLIKLPVNGSKTITVTGINKNGYSAKIDPKDVKWVVKGNIGKFDKGTFIATAKGTGYIDASVGDTHAYCAVSVAGESGTVKEGFETQNGSFLSYPSSVKGEYKLSTSQKKSGKSSGELTYSFTASEETQAAYLVFSDNGIPLDASTTKIGVWVYNTHINSNWLRAEVHDSKGQKHLVTLSKTLDWTGWKYVEASLEGISSPASLTRLYLAKVNPIADSGSIYFDDLTVTTSSSAPTDTIKIPQDTVPVDEANKSIQYQPSEDSFRFAVFGQSREPKNAFEKLLLTKLAEKTDKYLEAAALVGNNTRETAAMIKKPTVFTGTGYKSFDLMTSRFIQLDMSKQSLRLSDKSQWHWFLQQLDSFKGDNLFIFLAGSPDSFSDNLEANLFKETLTKYTQKTGRKVWVFYKGSQNSSRMERGVKYITCAGFDVESLTPDNTDAAKYILVTVRNGVATFEFKPII